VGGRRAVRVVPELRWRLLRPTVGGRRAVRVMPELRWRLLRPTMGLVEVVHKYGGGLLSRVLLEALIRMPFAGY
jgi:hypothetical protein